MYWPDVYELKRFYSSRLGQLVKRVLREHLKDELTVWERENILGLGFAIPVLKASNPGEACNVYCIMPGAQGALHWPSIRDNHCILSDEAELPIQDNMVDRIIAMHVIEHSYRPEDALKEMWRVLSPGGKLTIIVPNRSGIWSFSEGTPLGHGTPFSNGQLTKLVHNSGFTVIECFSGLFTPPSNRKFVIRISKYLERLIGRLFPFAGGVLILRAEKQIYAVMPEKAQRGKSKKTVLRAAQQPVMG
jgi:SAM-dependent methyltransferase